MQKINIIKLKKKQYSDRSKKKNKCEKKLKKSLCEYKMKKKDFEVKCLFYILYVYSCNPSGTKCTGSNLRWNINI